MAGWLLYGGEKFINLLAARDTMALVVLAHYGGIAHQYRDRWYLGSMGANLVLQVVQIVGSEAATRYLGWVGRVLGAGQRLAIRVPLQHHDEAVATESIVDHGLNFGNCRK